MRINTPLTIRESPQYGPGTGQAFNIFLESENQLNMQSMKTKSERVCSGHQQLQVNTKQKAILSLGGEMARKITRSVLMILDCLYMCEYELLLFDYMFFSASRHKWSYPIRNLSVTLFRPLRNYLQKKLTNKG